MEIFEKINDFEKNLKSVIGQTAAATNAADASMPPLEANGASVNTNVE